MSPIPNQNIGKIHNYKEPNLNTEFDRIYDFLAFGKFPEESLSGGKLTKGSVHETKLILPLSEDSVIHPDPTPDQPGYFVGGTVTVTAGPYTVLSSDLTVLVDDDLSGAITVTLPAAVDNQHRELHIKKIGSTAAVTVDGNGTDTIDDSLTQVILFQYDAMHLVCDGLSWWII
jgi:hypothetical protein